MEVQGSTAGPRLAPRPGRSDGSFGGSPTRNEAAELLDPFDGLSYGFDRVESGFMGWSSGPDRAPRTEDDLGVELMAEGG